MDTFFLSQRLLTIAKYRHSQILFKKERLYYYRYMLKLSYNLEYLGSKDVEDALKYVEKFRNVQGRRVKNGFFIKPRKALYLACMDAEDVLHGMKRWDGVSPGDWDYLGDRVELNFAKEKK